MLVQDMYDSGEMCCWIDNGFEVGAGLHHELALAPFLFAMVIDRYGQTRGSMDYVVRR